MKQKLLTVAFTLAALLMLSTSAFAMTDLDYMYNDANLRTGPSTGNSVICVIPSGLQVYLNSYSSDGSWVDVIYTDPTGNSVEGWTWAGNLNNYGASYRSGSSSSGSSGSVTSGGTAYVNATHLNLRSGPGTNYGILTSIPNGAAVTTYGSANGWSHVAWSNYDGYCSTQYLSSSYSAAASTPAASAPAASSDSLYLVGTHGTNSRGYYTVMATTADASMYAGEGTDGVMIVVPANQYVEMYSTDGSGYAFCGYNGYYGFIHLSQLR